MVVVVLVVVEVVVLVVVEVVVLVVVVGPPVVVVVAKHGVCAVSQFACASYAGGWQSHDGPQLSS